MREELENMSKQTTFTFSVTDFHFKMAKEMVSTLNVIEILDGSPFEEKGSLDASCSLVIHYYNSMLPCHFVRYISHA